MKRARAERQLADVPRMVPLPKVPHHRMPVKMQVGHTVLGVQPLELLLAEWPATKVPMRDWLKKMRTLKTNRRHRRMTALNFRKAKQKQMEHPETVITLQETSIQLKEIY